MCVSVFCLAYVFLMNFCSKKKNEARGFGFHMHIIFYTYTEFHRTLTHIMHENMLLYFVSALLERWHCERHSNFAFKNVQYVAKKLSTSTWNIFNSSLFFLYRSCLICRCFELYSRVHHPQTRKSFFFLSFSLSYLIAAMLCR